METVKQKWEDFWRAIAPPNASRVQMIETRRAFYAGSWSMLMACSNIGEDAVSEDAGVLWLEMWKQELMRFNEALKRGEV